MKEGIKMKKTKAQLIEELATVKTAVTMVEETAMQSVEELTTLQASYDELQKQFIQVNNQLTAAQSYSNEQKAMIDYLEQLLKRNGVA